MEGQKASQVLGRSTPVGILPALVLCLGVPASVLVYLAVENSINRIHHLQFAKLAAAANDVIDSRLRTYSDLLYALRAQFAAQDFVDRLTFHRFVKSLDIDSRYPGFLSVNYAAYVKHADKVKFVTAVRHDKSLVPNGYPKFDIKPPGDRPEYFVLTYLEPMDRFEFAFGIDLPGNPLAKDREKVLAAVRRHMDTGQMTSSAQPLTVLQGKKIIYLAMRLAIYKPGMPVETVVQRRSAYVGSVGAAFDIEGLVRAALASQPLSQIRCKLFDRGLLSDVDEGGRSSARQLIVDINYPNPSNSNQVDVSKPERILSFTDKVAIAGRSWEIEYSVPTELLVSGLDRWLPGLSLGAGLLTTFLLFGIVQMLATSRRRAMSIAANITRDLRDSEQGMAQAQRIAQMGSWALDPVAWTMSWSDETYRLFGLGPATMPRTYAEYLQRIYPEDRGAVDTKLRHALTANEDVSLEHRIVLPDASVRWVLTSARPTARNRLGHMPGIMIDTSDRKRAEGELKQSHEQLQYLSWQLVEAQEVERRRIATELHDVVGQNLTALSINLHIVQAQVANMKNAVAERRIADSATLLQSTTQAIEGVMSDLRPPMLDDYGLLPALQWYATQYSERNSIEVKTSGEENMPRLAPAAELALFRVVQEALNNVAKHAKASKVEIQVERDESQLILSVTDDGQGMAPAPPVMPLARRRRPGLGMITMRERIQTFGGTVVVQKAAGGGTRVEFRIPF